jgi:hypothetical protein
VYADPSPICAMPLGLPSSELPAVAGALGVAAGALGGAGDPTADAVPAHANMATSRQEIATTAVRSPRRQRVAATSSAATVALLDIVFVIGFPFAVTCAGGL